MKSIFGGSKSAEQQARDAIRAGKWKKAVAFYEKDLKENERDFSKWNLLGDLQFNNKAKSQAVESWRRALEGYSMEGLHENALGVARKILRRTPEEEDVYLLIADAYLGLEYYADCLASLRSYMKLAKRHSEPDMRSLLKRILDSNLEHPHLIEELSLLFKESQIEDIELERRIHTLADTHVVEKKVVEEVTEPEEMQLSSTDTDTMYQMATTSSTEDGLMVLDGMDLETGSLGESLTDPDYSLHTGQYEAPDLSNAFDNADMMMGEEMPSGEGKEHYDLGIVYREMKLWDAAITEFEQARRDQTCRLRATLAMCECMQETNDLTSAMRLLENEQQSEGGLPHERLNLKYQLGVIYETVGKMDEALQCYQTVREENESYGDTEERIAALKAKLSEATE